MFVSEGASKTTGQSEEGKVKPQDKLKGRWSQTKGRRDEF